MECHECAELLGAYADGELELSTSLQVEGHVQECARCARAMRTQRAVSEKLKDPGLRHRAGAALRERVLETVRREGKADTPATASIPAVFPMQRQVRVWRRLAIAALVGLVATLAFTGYRELRGQRGGATLASEVLASHVRSLMAAHVTDVVSSDQHTVKPWFMGKLDFSPEVEDLKEEGFPLAGGRLDYVNGHAVAALVFQRRQHVINLFTWPMGKGEEVAGPVDQAGYHVRAWSARGIMYWAVSDVNAEELEGFVKAYQARVGK